MGCCLRLFRRRFIGNSDGYLCRYTVLCVAYNSAARAAAASAWQVTDFNPETDLDAVAALYDLANEQQSGATARTRAYWDMAPSRLRSILPTVVARRIEGICASKLGGYLNYQLGGKVAEVLEVGYMSPTIRKKPWMCLCPHFFKHTALRK